MTQYPDYKTLSDGSIDYAFYERRTREIRALSLNTALKSLFGALTGLFRRRPTDKPVDCKIHPTMNIGTAGPVQHHILRLSNPF